DEVVEAQQLGPVPVDLAVEAQRRTRAPEGDVEPQTAELVVVRRGPVGGVSGSLGHGTPLLRAVEATAHAFKHRRPHGRRRSPRRPSTRPRGVRPWEREGGRSMAIRRIVTEDVDGRSRVAIDGAAPHTWCDEVWGTTADEPLGADPGDEPKALAAPPGG